MFNVDAYVIPMINAGMTYSDYRKSPQPTIIREMMMSGNVLDVFKGYLREIAIAEVFRLHGQGTDLIIDDPFRHALDLSRNTESEELTKMSSGLFNTRLFSYVLSTFIHFTREASYIDVSYRAEEIVAFLLFGDMESATIIDELKSFYDRLYREDSVDVMKIGLSHPSFRMENFDVNGSYLGGETAFPETDVNATVEEIIFSPLAALSMLFFYFQSLVRFGKYFDKDYFKECLVFLLKDSDISPDDPNAIQILKQRAAKELEYSKLKVMTILTNDCFGGRPGFDSLTDVPVKDILAFHYDAERHDKELEITSQSKLQLDPRHVAKVSMEMDNAATHFPPKYSRPS